MIDQGQNVSQRNHGTWTNPAAVPCVLPHFSDRSLNGNLIVHEVQVKETSLLYIGKLVKLCKNPCTGTDSDAARCFLRILVLHLSGNISR